MNFEEWYDDHLPDLLKGNLHDALAEAWQAAQQAERIRYRKLFEAAIMFIDAYDFNVDATEDLEAAYHATHAAIRDIQNPDAED